MYVKTHKYIQMYYTYIFTNFHDKHVNQFFSGDRKPYKKINYFQIKNICFEYV